MKRISIKAYLVAAALAATSAASLAAETGQMAQPAQSSSGTANKTDMPMQHGMMDSEGAEGGKGMMHGDGMMGMMRSCHQMMAGQGEATLPHLPPGNDKLDFKMRAEMMRKMGEIAAKYADQIKENP
ncbi:MAG: hypothetical protein ABI135_04430 [Rhodoferax sp.]